MRQCVDAATAGLWRYETNDEITLLRVAAYLPGAATKWPVGTRTPIKGNTLATEVQLTGRPARMDTYDNSTGTLAKLVHAIGLRAAGGVPVIVDGRLWGLAAVGSQRAGPMPAGTEAHLSDCAELIATALVAGYRDEQNRQLLAEVSGRSELIDALLAGRAFDEWTLRDLASQLRLPITGPYVVVAAQAPRSDAEPVPEIEAKLRSLDIFSAWRRLPDLQVGVVHVACGRKLDDDRAGGRQCGVQGSARYAIRTARGEGNGARRHRLHIFGGGVRRLHPVHRCRERPGCDDQNGRHCAGRSWRSSRRGTGDTLQTFRVWRDFDGSANAAAEMLNCHPNTVRQRLRRIENRTGRSLSRPKELAELCLAFEVHRRLMWTKPTEAMDERIASTLTIPHGPGRVGSRRGPGNRRHPWLIQLATHVSATRPCTGCDCDWLVMNFGSQVTAGPTRSSQVATRV